jgi:hypothetical protein
MDGENAEQKVDSQRRKKFFLSPETFDVAAATTAQPIVICPPT